MTKSKVRFLLAIAPAFLLSGCFNMPTPTSQITGAYTSGLRYEDYDCSKLSSELDSLARRENQLVVAQEQRIKTSQIQAFWWGFGQGDGIEASELANVRGEKEAVRKALDSKTCGEGVPTAKATQAVKPVQQAKPDSATEQQNKSAQSTPRVYELNLDNANKN